MLHSSPRSTAARAGWSLDPRPGPWARGLRAGSNDREAARASGPRTACPAIPIFASRNPVVLDRAGGPGRELGARDRIHRLAAAHAPGLERRAHAVGARHRGRAGARFADGPVPDS